MKDIDDILTGIMLTMDHSSDMISLWRNDSPPQLIHASARIARLMDSQFLTEEVHDHIERAGGQPFTQALDTLKKGFGELYINAITPVNASGYYLVTHKRVPYPFEMEHHPRNPRVSQLEHQIVRNLIHELLTPINSIEGLGEELQDSVPDDSIRETLRLHDEACRVIKTHVTDIVNAVSLHNLESRRFEPQDFDLFETLFSISSKANRTITEQRRDLHFRLSPPARYESLPMRGFPELLEQLLLHLLDNAIKFTPDGGEIRLDIILGSDLGSGKALHFSVSDTGVGIDPGQHKLIFRPMILGNMEDTRETKGLGLGLSAATDCLVIICDDSEAEISLESDVGKGARFSFTIPYLEVTGYEPRSHSTALQLPRAPGDYHILVAEDNPTQQLIIHRLILKLGFQCTLTSNGIEAVGEYVRADTHYDLILMDIQMPGISGLEATRLIRNHEQEFGHDNVPIVAVTANIEQEVHSQCLRAGMDGHFGKPVRRVVLDELIRKALLGISMMPASVGPHPGISKEPE